MQDNNSNYCNSLVKMANIGISINLKFLVRLFRFPILQYFQPLNSDAAIPSSPIFNRNVLPYQNLVCSLVVQSVAHSFETQRDTRSFYSLFSSIPCHLAIITLTFATIVMDHYHLVSLSLMTCQHLAGYRFALH